MILSDARQTPSLCGPMFPIPVEYMRWSCRAHSKHPPTSPVPCIHIRTGKTPICMSRSVPHAQRTQPAVLWRPEDRELWVVREGLRILIRATSAASSLALLMNCPSYQLRAGMLWPWMVTVEVQAVRPPKGMISNCFDYARSQEAFFLGTTLTRHTTSIGQDVEDWCRKAMFATFSWKKVSTVATWVVICRTHRPTPLARWRETSRPWWRCCG
jgi:hypothetical protein